MNGDTVTYVVTRNIQYTNVCYFKCGFCAFSKGKLAENLRGRRISAARGDRAPRRGRPGARCVEVCLQGGIHPAFDGDYYLSVVRAIKDAVPGIHVHAFSALEIWQGRPRSACRSPTTWSCCATKASSLPGTAAEVLDDEVRRVICPDKVTTDQWLEVHDPPAVPRLEQQ